MSVCRSFVVVSFSFNVPTPAGPKAFTVDPGTTLYILGANGGGKTRLAVEIETALAEKAHRIAAHRALSLNPEVAKISEQAALNGLRIGHTSADAQVSQRRGHRWQSKAAINLLSDYDYLVQALFADQANTSLISHKIGRAGRVEAFSPTKFERLEEIWDRVLPHRKLVISGDDVRVEAGARTDPYPASEMSDGERAVFYLLGQTLVAAPDSVVIFDEPELHIHRAILARLWDEIEAARPDCAFVVISHDLEFIASREGQKFVIRDYLPAVGWTIEDVPDETGFSEEITTLILGSRRPILFVEGTGTSLDQAIYRACFPDWTIIPRGACEEVIHAVATMRANASLTRITCAGIVDADDYPLSEQQFLEVRGILVLPVSEIENLFMLPTVLTALLQHEGYQGRELKERADTLTDELFAMASDAAAQRSAVLRYCRRRIDRALKKVDLSDSNDVAALAAAYSQATAAIDVHTLAAAAENAITSSIAERDSEQLLKWFDNKGVLAIAAKAKGMNKLLFEQWLVRSLRNGSAPLVTAAIRQRLPSPVAS
jgi:ABC-type branched-subunit amino acid transport system ATPase component